MEKREMNIPRQWEKRVLGKGSPYFAKRESLYPDDNRASELERTIRNLSSKAKLSLIQPEIEKAKKSAKKTMWEKSLLAPSLGSDEDSLPDDPWFSKSPEEKHADVIQEEHGQYEDGLFVSEDEGEDKLLNKLAREEFESGNADTPFADSPSYTRIKEDTEGGSALDRISAEDRGRTAAMADFKEEEEGGTWDSLKGLFASDEDSAPGTKPESKGLSPMQKYGAKLITDIFAEKEEAPQQSIGASPLTPGRTFDMSYLKSRPKKDRYRNMGLLGRV